MDFDNDHSLAQPLLEHLRRSFGYLRTHKGPHGLPLIGRADWNDCLNLNCFSKEPGESFQTTGPVSYTHLRLNRLLFIGIGFI